jgi:hypothetical protein
VTNSTISSQIKERVERSFRENAWYLKLMDLLNISMLTQGKFGTTKISLSLHLSLIHPIMLTPHSTNKL